LHVTDGSGAQTTSSLTREQARMLSWKLRNSPRVAPEMPHWNGIGKYSPCISFDAGALTINGGGYGDADGSGYFAFKDDDLEFEQDDGPVYRWIAVSNSDLLHLRDQLNKLFPPASGIETEGHDPEEGHGAEHESATPKGDAHTLSNTDPGPPGVRS
jgi:hypothetical protein